MKTIFQAESGGLSIPDEQILAARDWLNAGAWDGMEMVVNPMDYPRDCGRYDMVRDIERAIDRHYDGGVVGFLEDHS